MANEIGAAAWLQQVQQAERQSEEKLRAAQQNARDAQHSMENTLRQMRETAQKDAQAAWQAAMEAQERKAKDEVEELAAREAERCTAMRDAAATKIAEVAQALVNRVVSEYGHH